MFPHVDRIPARRDRAELLEESLAIDDGALREARQAVGQQGAELVLGLEGKIGLARRRRVERQRLPELRDDADGPIGLHHLDRDDPGAAEHRDVGRLPHLPHELTHDGARLAQEPHVLHVALTQLETADAEAIVLRCPVLLDVAARLERREQAEDVVLVELQALGELRHPELLGLAAELLEDVQAVGDRLDDVVGFLAPHDRISRKAVLGYVGLPG